MKQEIKSFLKLSGGTQSPVKRASFGTPFLLAFLFSGGVLTASPAAQPEPTEKVDGLAPEVESRGSGTDLAARQTELEEKLEILTRELQKKSRGSATEPAAGVGYDYTSSWTGLGGAASKVYYAPTGVSLGGYGEIKYHNYGLSEEPAGPNEMDVHRFILYAGYRFNEDIILNSEIEFEHAGFKHQDGGPNEPEVFVEFATVDYLFTDAFNLRAGLMLIPLGMVNINHEPVSFRGTERPFTESSILPSTWREIGVSAFGKWKAARLDYKIGIVNGQNPLGLSEDKWLKGTRQKGSEAKADSVAGFGLAEVNLTNNWKTGIGGYYGGLEQDVLDNSTDLALAEVHTEFQWRGWRLRALGAMGWLNNISEVNSTVTAFNGETTNIGSRTWGYYGVISYNILNLFPLKGKAAQMVLRPFVRWEQVNLHAAVADDQTPNPARETSIITAGVEYLPITNLVIKLDWQRISSADESEPTQQIVHTSLGFIF